MNAMNVLTGPRPGQDLMVSGPRTLGWSGQDLSTGAALFLVALVALAVGVRRS
jgi:hypothetical protein